MPPLQCPSRSLVLQQSPLAGRPPRRLQTVVVRKLCSLGRQVTTVTVEEGGM